MKGFKKRLLSGLLSLIILTLTACAGSGGKEAATDKGKGKEKGKGRYLETDIEKPSGVERIMCMRKLADGTIRMATDKGIFDSSDDGKTFAESKFQYQIAEMKTEDDYFAQASFDSKGRLLLSYASGLVRVELDGTEQTLPVSLPAMEETGGTENMQMENFLFTMQMSQEDMLIGTDIQGNAYLIQPESGEIIKKWEQTSGEAPMEGATIVGKRMVVPTMEGIDVYNIETGELEEPEAAFSEYFAENKESVASESMSRKIIAAPQEDTLYYIDNTGVYRYTFGSGKLERIINGELCSLASPNLQLADFIPKEDGGFLASFSGDSGYYLKDYNYSKEASAVPENELKVYALHDSTWVRQAIAGFQAKNPDYYVSLEVGMSGGDSITEEDAIKKLNTDMLAGKGPDLIVTDGLPLESYIEKGVLTDLTDTLDEMSKESAFFEKVLYANRTKDGLYAVPTCFVLPVLAGSDEEIQGVNDLSGLAEAVKTIRAENPDLKSIMGSYTAESLAELMLTLSSAEIWKSGEKINEEALSGYINSMKALYAANGQSGEEEMQAMVKNGVSSQTTELSQAQSAISSSLMDLLSSKQKLYAGTLRSMFDLQTLIGYLQQSGGNYKPLNGLSQQVFLPSDTIAINDKSRDVRGAKSFLKFMLAADTQSSSSASGFPVNKEALDKSYEALKEKNSSLSMSDEGGGVQAVTLTLGTKEDYDKFVSYLEGAANTPTNNAIVTNAIVKTVSKCMSNQSDTAEAVAEVVKAVNLYLSE